MCMYVIHKDFGMNMYATVYALSTGIRFLSKSMKVLTPRSVKWILISSFTQIPNILMEQNVIII